MLSLIKIKDIHQCEDTAHVYAIVRTGPRATHIVRAGDLVSAGTMLVTSDIGVARGAKEAMPPTSFKKYSHIAL